MSDKSKSPEIESSDSTVCCGAMVKFCCRQCGAKYHIGHDEDLEIYQFECMLCGDGFVERNRVQPALDAAACLDRINTYIADRMNHLRQTEEHDEAQLYTATLIQRDVLQLSKDITQYE